jgi:MarR family transcriptional regulator, negative regulator of the multidrug operon emrRAB
MSERTANLLAAAGQRVADAVTARLEDTLTHTASAPAAIMTIAHHPGLSIERLSEAVGITDSGGVRLIDRLAADGLVRREKLSARMVRLHLTPCGQRAVERIEQARIAAATDLLSPLSGAQRRQLEAVLARILAAQTHGEDDLRRICRLCSFDACESGGRACPVAAQLEAGTSSSIVTGK